MVTAGCESPSGEGGDKAVFTEAAASESAAGTIESAAGTVRKIRVKFRVLNGGWGLYDTRGIASTEDDSYLEMNTGDWAGDFHITLWWVPVSDRYLNIRWKAMDTWTDYTYVKAKMPINSAESEYVITLDYNGVAEVATKNLYDVRVRDYDVDDDFAWAHTWADSMAGVP